MEPKITSTDFADWLRKNPVKELTRKEKLNRALDEIKKTYAKKDVDKTT